MSFTLGRWAAGVALLTALAAGCGTAAAGHSSGPKPPPATTHPAAPAHTANPIPQHNGGDQDPDNNGGPSDGDGNI